MAYAKRQSFWPAIILFFLSELSNLAVHSASHTFSSMCYRAGISDKFIQDMMGHATLAMTMDTYTHTMAQGTSPVWDYAKTLAEKLKKH